jgi:hypothetical protein
LLAIICRDGIRIYDIISKKRILHAGHEIYPSQVSFDQERQVIAVVDTDNVATIWDLRPFLRAEDSPSGGSAQLDWAQEADITPPDGFVLNGQFGQCLKKFRVHYSCRDMQLTGATGLEDKVRDWLKDRGAVWESGLLDKFTSFFRTSNSS